MFSFSHLDLLRGYWKINAVEQDRKLSFGLTNAPACFMRAMHLILKGFCWSDCLVYLDDIIIFGRILDSDANDSGLGVVLSQVQSGMEHVIEYAVRQSQRLRGIITPPARNYWPLCGQRSTSRHSSMFNIFWPRLTIVLCNG